MSVFSQFIKLRNEFGERLNLNVSFLNNLKVSTSDIVNTGSVQLSKKQIAWFENGQLRLKGQSSDLTIEDPTEVSTLKSEILFDGEYVTVGDLMDQVAASADAYQILSQLSAKYSYSTRVSFSDVESLLSGLTTDDIQQLKMDLFSAANDEGFITKPSFVAVLNNWFKRADEGVSVDQPDLDESNPYTVQALVAAVVSTVASTVSTICLLLHNIFTVIIGLIAGLISLLCNVVSAVKKEIDYEYDPLTGNTFVEGPIGAINGVASETNVNFSTYGLVNDGHINYYEGPGITTFMWKKGTAILNNTYFFPYFKPQATVNYLVNQGLVTVAAGSVNQVLTFTDIYEIRRFMGSKARIPDSIVYTDGEQPATAEELIFSLGVGYILQTLFVHGRNYSSSDHGSISVTLDLNPETHSTWANDENLTRVCLWLFCQVMPDDESFTKYAVSKSVHDLISSYMASWIADDIIPKRSSLLCRASGFSNLTVSSAAGFPVLYAPCLANSACTGFTADTVYYYCDNDNHFTNSGGTTNICSDCLPVQFGFRLPRANIVKLRTILASTAIATTVLAFAVSRISVYVQKRMIGKQTLRAARIAKAREAFLNDPTNETLRTEYENLVWKYNKFGKWFGWGSFDGANGWFNADSTDTSNSSDMMSRLYSKSSASQTYTIDDVYAIVTDIRNHIYTPE